MLEGRLARFFEHRLLIDAHEISLEGLNLSPHREKGRRLALRHASVGALEDKQMTPSKNSFESLQNPRAPQPAPLAVPPELLTAVDTGKSLVIFSFRHRLMARVTILALALIGTFFGIASPLFQKLFVDQLLNTPDKAMELFRDIGPITAIVAAFFCTVISQGLGLLGNFLSIKEGAYLQKIFGHALYRKMLSIRPDSLGSTTVGEVVSLYAVDVAGSTALIDQVLPMASMIFCNLAIAPFAVYWLCGIPVWTTVLVMVTIISLTLVLSARQSRFFALFKQLAADRTGIVNEWVQTIRLLRILGWVESFEKKIFAKREEETYNRVAMVTNGQLMNAFGSSINFVLNLCSVASLIYLSGQKVSPGQLFALLWIFGVFLARSFRQIPWFFTFLLDSFTSMRRLDRFLARSSDAGLVDEAMAAGSARGLSENLGLKVNGLNLKIQGQTILKDISFDLQPGEFAAIVGEVGSGKSSLVLSLVGENGATFEKLQIGSVDGKSLNLTERRKYFSFVPQEGFVMTASLRENIVFEYEPPAADDLDPDIHHSLATAQFKLADELQGPGLDTEIGERGVNMSGGQRQRVALARAHYVRRPILLLDDCLSAVDVDTEKQLVRDLLAGAWKGRTRLLVTHRLSILNLVDRVFFMEDGRIIEQGPFRELLAKSRKVQEFVASVHRAEAKAADAGRTADVEAE